MTTNLKVRIFAFAFFLVINLPSEAKQYFTIEEAQRVLFPSAEIFERQVVKFTAREKADIEKKSGTKVRNLGNYVWMVKKGGKIIGLVVLDFVFGKHELIDYAVGMTPDGKVCGIEVLVYRESYGNEIRSEKWRAQFKGKDSAADLRLNGDIDNVSGATISCRNVTAGVKRLVATFEIVLRPRFKLP